MSIDISELLDNCGSTDFLGSEVLNNSVRTYCLLACMPVLFLSRKSIFFFQSDKLSLGLVERGVEPIKNKSLRARQL